MQNVAMELAALDQMSTGDLAARYRELHGQPCRTRHRAYLIRKVAWRIQANAEGDLTERARGRATELADDAEIRVMAPKTMICPPQIEMPVEQLPLGERGKLFLRPVGKHRVGQVKQVDTAPELAGALFGGAMGPLGDHPHQPVLARK